MKAKKWNISLKWILIGFLGLIFLGSIIGYSNTKNSTSSTKAPSNSPSPTTIITLTPTQTITPTIIFYKIGDNSLYPNYSLTPGESFTGVTATQICVSGYTSTVRSVSGSLKQQVFAEYGIPYANHANYEVDHFIPLELGGDNSIKNLWPEYGTIPNPKDKVENYLHSQVCNGSLSLQEAQNRIISDWYKVYLSVYGNSNTYVPY